MTRCSSIMLAAMLTVPAAALADNHFQDMARDALRDAQRFTDYTQERAEETLAIPVETDLPQSDMTTGDLQDAGLLAAGSASTEGTAYSTFSGNIADWGVSSTDQSLLSVADGAVSDPDALVDPNTFTTSGGACTVDDFSDAPPFQRVCSLQRDIYQSSCTSTAEIEVTRVQLHSCSRELVPFYGWAETCGPELDAAPSCTAQQTVCNFAIGTQCYDEVTYYSCEHTPGSTIVGNPVGSPTYSDPVITWTNSCDANYAASRCYNPVETCVSGPSVEDVNGLLVPMDCTERQTSYTCAAETYTSDCAPFETDPACRLESSVCYSMDPDGVCGAFEQTYACGSSGSEAFDASCEAVNVCVGGTCQSIPQEANDDIVLALVGVEALNTLADELQHDASVLDALSGDLNGDFDVAYFTATERNCRIGVLGTINCCQDSGWALGSIAECSASEVTLYGAQEAGAAVYMETFCSSEFLFLCAQRSRRYCTFNSRIARIISEQGQRQLYGAFDCRAMTQEELEAVDWSRIDFSAAFAEMFNNVGSIAPSDLTGLIQENIIVSQPQVVDIYE